MADRISVEHRSWNMSRIRSRDTMPEMRVRSALHRAGFRFKINDKRLPGSPDLVLPKYNTVIFVHGCYWHRHKRCQYAYQPKTRVDFWEQKFKANVSRDARKQKELEFLEWRVFTIWECQTNSREGIVHLMNTFLDIDL